MLPTNTTIGAVTLNVADLNRMRDFYVRLVGLQVRTDAVGRVTLGTETADLVSLRQPDNGRYALRTTGLYHLALRVPDRRALAHWLQHYAAQNAPYWQGASDHGVSAALYLTDPEGNGIEIYHDRPRDGWTLDADGQIVALQKRLDLDALLQSAPQARWQGLPPQTDMGHIHLSVNDLAAARAFYVDLLGFSVKTAYGNSALFVAAGDYHHHIGLNTWQTLGASPRTAAMYGLAEAVVVLPDATAVVDTAARLAAADYPHARSTGGDCLLQDPAGICLRLTTATSAD